MKIDGSSVRVILTLKTNGYFEQLPHVSPYKDSTLSYSQGPLNNEDTHPYVKPAFIAILLQN